jgi:hypothetical protein
MIAAVRKLALRLLTAILGRWSEAKIERRLGSRPGLRAIFAGLARSFVPGAVPGFEGCLVYELTFPATRRPPASWSVQIAGGRAHARPGGCSAPVLTLRLQLTDLLRIGAGTLDPVTPILQGRGTVEGPLDLAMRLPEMFAG